MLPKFFEHLRTKLGDEVELLHDVHERVTLNQAINLCKALEPYRLFFLEDPFPPEDNDHFRLLRQQTSIPLAMGELFNTQHEYLPLIKERLIDFIRIHISQIGGLSPARKVAALCEYFGVRTAWHGPGDASPVAHAAQLALELASYNFGVHEGGSFPKETQEVFVGCPEVKNGYMLAQEKPGLGIEVDEKLAAKFPIPAGPAELRLFVGHDAAQRRHGDQTVEETGERASGGTGEPATPRLREPANLRPGLTSTCRKSTLATCRDSTCLHHKTEVPYGVLDLVILQTLAAMGPMHGYSIARRIEQVADNLLTMSQGSIYPALIRLEQKGWIETQWGVSETRRR